MRNPKIVYIAHKIGGDVQKNIMNVISILKRFHSKAIIPIAPYIPTLSYLDDLNPDERILGMEANKIYFTKNFIDELWVCSDISSGVEAEINMAKTLKIPIKFKNIK